MVREQRKLVPQQNEYFCFPLQKNTCLICQKVVKDLREKVNLFKQDTVMSSGELIEKVFDSKIASLGFQSTCRGCLRKVQNLDKKFTELKNQIDQVLLMFLFFIYTNILSKRQNDLATPVCSSLLGVSNQNNFS